MIIEVCFIYSFIVCILFTFNMAGRVLGNGMHTPLPLLHLLGLDASDTYIYTPAIAFQVWFWSHHYGLFI